MAKIAKDLKDVARRHNSKILYWHDNKLRGTTQSGLVPVKGRNGATINNNATVNRDGQTILKMC